MALSRRTGQRFQASIWPGFVDAMTSLLLVLFFVLSIFMVVQFVLRETISGQESELDVLTGEVAALAQALGMAERRGTALASQVGELTTTLETSQLRISELRDSLGSAEVQIATLLRDRSRNIDALEAAQSKITAFEAQVAALIAERDTALAEVDAADLRETELLSEQEALNLALAQARDEIDAGTEAARLAAARREALDALIADLRARNAVSAERETALRAELDAASDALSAEEQARLAEAAAAEALREKLSEADAELTSMTLALEAQRKQAEETLTLLAAADAAQDELDAKLISALLQIEALTQARDASSGDLTTMTRERDDLSAENAILKSELTSALAAVEAQGQTVSDRDTALAALQRDKAALQTRLDEVSARLERVLSEGGATLARAEELRAEKEDLERRLADALAQAADSEEVAEADRAALRAQLAEALAAKLAAQTLAEDKSSQVDRQEALLAAAKAALDEETTSATEAQKQATLLNQQVAALRDQIGELQGLLADAKSKDAARDVQLQSLGTELNTALARVAAEERRRRTLEEAERKRLEEERARLTAETRNLERYRSEFFGQLRDLLGTQEGVRIVGDRFVFSSEVLFPVGRADLSREGRQEIAKVAAILQQVAGDIPPEIDWVLQVDGHTDNVPLSGFGEFADNWELSQARALSVVRYMVDVLGLAPDRLSANGFGEFQPVNPADTNAARAQNRRIEIKFTEK